MADEDEVEDDELYEPPYEPWPDSITYDFERARVESWQRVRRRDFAEVVREFKALEQTFVSRAGEDASYTLFVRRRVAEDLLEFAICYNKEPFQTCHRLWDELLQYGFIATEQKCASTWFFIDSCRQHGQVDIGLGVLDPLLAELKEMMSAPDAPKPLKRYCRSELATLGKLRTELEALRG